MRNCSIRVSATTCFVEYSTTSLVDDALTEITVMCDFAAQLFDQDQGHDPSRSRCFGGLEHCSRLSQNVIADTNEFPVCYPRLPFDPGIAG